LLWFGFRQNNRLGLSQRSGLLCPRLALRRNFGRLPQAGSIRGLYGGGINRWRRRYPRSRQATGALWLDEDNRPKDNTQRHQDKCAYQPLLENIIHAVLS
jgi:hypothetical protein